MSDFNFCQLVDDYESALNDLIGDHDLSRLKSVVHIEGLRDWSQFMDIGEVEQWFLSQRLGCSMVIEDIPLSECKGWSIDLDGDGITNQSGDFFKVQGLRIRNTDFREA